MLLHKSAEVLVRLDEALKVAQRNHLTLIKIHDLVGIGKEAEVVGDEDDKLVVEELLDRLREDMLADVGIDSGERIVHDDNVTI